MVREDGMNAQRMTSGVCESSRTIGDMFTRRVEPGEARPVWTFASLVLGLLGPVCGLGLYVLAFPDTHMGSDGVQHLAVAFETIGFMLRSVAIWFGGAMLGLGAAAIGAARKESASSLRRFSTTLNGVVVLLVATLWTMSIFN